ncbi:hypothetical protein OAN307_c06900 [Octadecabacter antarcticus 307]|uniref:Uncharacterized protein n=1 Tax=Octadecabacter antarcticus 307 TaxID=391626 RepID=M9R2E9_9RHOB|nr:hypothetical protein [Octadecabacter antarcticus]AGI66417.1 hypothetical protein OAN307_c06900 [Octadecabacter antarcticus 307]
MEVTKLKYSVLMFIVGQGAWADVVSDGRLAHGAWECAAKAGVSESYVEQSEGLFDLGYNILSRIISEAKSGETPEEELDDLPVGITWRISGGPSTDFQLGALWTHYTIDAYDETWPDIVGAAFDVQENLQMKAADADFQTKNCEFLVPQ